MLEICVCHKIFIYCVQWNVVCINFYFNFNIFNTFLSSFLDVASAESKVGDLGVKVSSAYFYTE